MRNLKKILALALALVMSLSLMVTASAARTEFADQDKISENYTLAVEVLNELGVLKGDANGFRPTDTITRGEVAAIIYRIFTGRTEEPTADGHTIYTAADGEFADVKGHWAEGYMVYSFQGGYIKGWPGAGGINLNPGGDVTGYEVLTMILRAVGYDKKENEFTGLNWKVNVATTATTLGVLDNYYKGTGSDLSAAATREQVADMIFRCILLPKVEYNLVLNAYSTPDASNTIASGALKLAVIEGVVTANEWADLDSGKTLADGQTRLVDKNGKVYNLAISSGLDDIGERRCAYVQNGTTVLLDTLEDTGDNVVYDNADHDGAATTVSAAAKAAGLSTTGAEYYVNFGEGTTYVSSDWKIKYVLDLDELVDSDSKTWSYLIEDSTGTARAADKDKTYDKKIGAASEDGTVVSTLMKDTQGNVIKDKDGNDVYHFIYTRTINIGKEITELDHDLIYWIFDNADKHSDADTPGDYEIGEVYVGTASNHDISEDISFKKFWETYVISGENDVSFSGCGNGEWLKVIDNDGDGVAEYVFKTTYALDQIMAVITRNDVDTYHYNKLDTSGYAVRYIDMTEDDLEKGFAVVYCIIDGVVNIQPARTEEVKVNTYHYDTDTITTFEPVADYGQSAIDNNTDMDEDIINVDDDTAYILYLDRFGYVRAYKLAEPVKYGLLTEVYGRRSANTAAVTRLRMTAELTRAGIDDEPDEYTVLNGSSTPFWNDDVDSTTQNTAGNALAWPYVGVTTDPEYDNHLQRAISGLDLDGRFYNSAAANNTTAVGDHQEFDYATHTGGTENCADHDDHTWTNVAKYALDEDDGVYLYSASQYMYNKDGEQLYYANLDEDGTTYKLTRYTRDEYIAAVKAANNANVAGVPTVADAESYISTRGVIDEAAVAADGVTLTYVYAVDYVQLSKINNANNHNSDYTHIRIPDSYENVATSNGYVDADVNTVFYVVFEDGSIFQNTGSLPSMWSTPLYGGSVHAIYAVARNTSNDYEEQDYWIADVVVIEVNDSPASQHTSIALLYGNPSKSSRQTRLLGSLDNGENGIEMDVYPSTGTWPGVWNTGDYGFYALENETVRADGTVDADIVRIPGTHTHLGVVEGYNYHGIFAGIVSRTTGLTYIDVDKDGDGSGFDQKLTVEGVLVYRIYKDGSMEWISRSQGDLEKHAIIWVYNFGATSAQVSGGTNISYIIDLGRVDGGYADNPVWLYDGDHSKVDSIWEEIAFEQGFGYYWLLKKIDALDKTSYDNRDEVEELYDEIQDWNDDYSPAVSSSDTEELDLYYAKLKVLDAIDEAVDDADVDPTNPILADAIKAAKEAVKNATSVDDLETYLDGDGNFDADSANDEIPELDALADTLDAAGNPGSTPEFPQKDTPPTDAEEVEEYVEEREHVADEEAALAFLGAEYGADENGITITVTLSNARWTGKDGDFFGDLVHGDAVYLGVLLKDFTSGCKNYKITINGKNAPVDGPQLENSKYYEYFRVAEKGSGDDYTMCSDRPAGTYVFVMTWTDAAEETYYEQTVTLIIE